MGCDMVRPGQYGAVLASYSPFAFVLNVLGYPVTALIGLLATILLVRLPELDQHLPHSHEQPLFHTVWCALLSGLALAFISGILTADYGTLVSLTAAGGGFLLGITSVGIHLFLDTFTPTGITPLAPLSTRTYKMERNLCDDPLVDYLLLTLGIGTLGSAIGLTVFIS